MLTDKQLKQFIKEKKISIEPYNEKKIKAGKYDIHLGKYLLQPVPTKVVIDPTDPKTTPEYKKLDLESMGDEGYLLKPQEFILGQTLEQIGVAADVGMFLDGSTTFARLGLTIHQSANYIPPGQDPHIITLEIFNASPWQIKLSYKMRVGKVIAFRYEEDNTISAKDYNRYNAQQETTGAIFKPNNDS